MSQAPTSTAYGEEEGEAGVDRQRHRKKGHVQEEEEGSDEEGERAEHAVRRQGVHAHLRARRAACGRVAVGAGRHARACEAETAARDGAEQEDDEPGGPDAPADQEAAGAAPEAGQGEPGAGDGAPDAPVLVRKELARRRHRGCDGPGVDD